MVEYVRMETFNLISKYKTSPDQQSAIEKIIENIDTHPKQTLLGVTGSGKTFVMANIIES